MLTESALTGDQLLDLGKEIAASRFHAEMAVINEWILSEAKDPDRLFTIFVAPTDDGEIQTACSCPRGTKDDPCPHALVVVSAIRSEASLTNQLFRKESQPLAVA